MNHIRIQVDLDVDKTIVVRIYNLKDVFDFDILSSFDLCDIFLRLIVSSSLENL